MPAFEGNSLQGLIARLRGVFYHRDDRTMKVYGLAVSNVAKTADYTVAYGDFVVGVAPSSADITVTLPAVATCLGQIFVIVKNNAATYNVIVDGAGSETIGPDTTFTLSKQYDCLMVEAGGTNWRVLSKTSAGQSAPYVAKTANYTLTVTDGTVECTANSFTITLPTAAGATGRVYNIKNSGNGVITINTTSSQTIDGNASGVLKLVQYDNLTVQSNGANWIIL